VATVTVEAAVNDALDRAPRDEHGELVLPIDVAHIALEFGIRVLVKADGIAGHVTINTTGTPISGLAHFDKRRIYVDGRDVAGRQRFTAAHELGHFLLGHHALFGEGEHVDTDVGTWDGDEEDTSHDPIARAEADADRFAGLLVMPPNLVDREVDDIGASVPAIAERFDVTRRACEVHLARYLLPRMERPT
jgi:Zn-dependent peptidase ImmA (M78 family)